jgi:RNA polymerase sigma-70 factor (ECF subfamily)
MSRHEPIGGLEESSKEATDAVDQGMRNAEGQHELGKLRETLERDYASLVGRLTAALRSHDDAVAALHDAYVRLAKAPAVDEVRQPFAYLYRMALNLARNSLKREAKYIEIDQGRLFDLPDDAPDPERATLIKIDASRASDVLAHLSERRREIFLARWRDGLGHAEIAVQFGVHKRTVQKELARAERILKKLLDNA